MTRHKDGNMSCDDVKGNSAGHSCFWQEVTILLTRHWLYAPLDENGLKIEGKMTESNQEWSENNTGMTRDELQANECTEKMKRQFDSRWLQKWLVD